MAVDVAEQLSDGYQWLSLSDTVATTGLSTSTVYRRVKAGTFQRDRSQRPTLYGIPIVVEGDSQTVERDSQTVVGGDSAATDEWKDGYHGDSQLTVDVTEVVKLREWLDDMMAITKSQEQTIREQSGVIDSQRRMIEERDGMITALQAAESPAAPVREVSIRGAHARSWWRFWGR